MTEPTQDELPSQTPAEKKSGPGVRLREAREARRLTIEAAANQLHVDPQVLRALEDDEYGTFAAPIFVTGHLRAYARLLDLPPEPLIEAYRNLGPAEPPPLKQVSRRLHFGSSSSSFSPVAIILLLLLLAAIVLFSLQRGERATDAGSPAAQNEPSPLPDASPLPDLGATAAPPEDLLAPVTSTPATPADVPAATPTPPALSPATSLPRAAGGPRATLSLRADQASWVEVRDANGRRLLYDLLDSGGTRNVEGLPPFDVLLGYGPGVAVEFNGKLVDHSRYMREDVARFRVGEKGIDRL